MDDTLLDSLIPIAQNEAQQFRHKYIRAEHLLLALLRLPVDPASNLLQQHGIDYAALAARVHELSCPLCEAEETLELANGAVRALQIAQSTAGDEPLHGGHVLGGILQVSPLVRALLTELGVKLATLIPALQEG